MYLTVVVFYNVKMNVFYRCENFLIQVVIKFMGFDALWSYWIIVDLCRVPVLFPSSTYCPNNLIDYSSGRNCMGIVSNKVYNKLLLACKKKL